MSDVAVVSVDSQRHKSLEKLFPHVLDVRSGSMAMITESLRRSAVLRDVYEFTDRRKTASLPLKIGDIDVWRSCWDGDEGALRALSTAELASLAQVRCLDYESCSLPAQT